MQSARWLVPLVLLAVVAHAYERPTLVTESVSDDHAVDGGAWNSLLKRTASPWPCGRRTRPRLG